MKVCIAEKPSVAKEIANILGANSRRDGYYEGSGYQVTWTFGHFCTLKTPDDYTDTWKRWNLGYLPMIPQRFGIKLKDNDGVAKQFNTIKDLIEKCDEVINCGDAGIEGELIQRWVLQKAKCKVPVKRLWISSLTEEAIREGFKHLKDANDYNNLYAAGSARAIGDWLLGMNASRLYTLKYSNGKGVLSVGRVQTPTLALIVKRHKEIEDFKSETFWELKTIYRDTAFNSTKGKFKTLESANEVIEKIKDSDFEIKSFTQKKGKEASPKLFDLTALQVECNNKFSFSADETLKYIQQLYEGKMVTYPRVDTSFLPEDMYPKIQGIMKQMTPYLKFTEPLLKAKIKKSKKIFDNKKITDHHAIIPTGVYPKALTPQQKQVYDTIARRFLSVFYPDCIVSNTTVIGEVEGYSFKATGKIILEEGWRVLYPKKANAEGKTSDAKQIMPAFEKGEKGPHEPATTEKQTSPPKYYTEASLLRAMETAGKQIDDEELRDAMKENGIGRPSTRANVIETLFRRKYVTRVRKSLKPTITGIQLIDTISNDLLKSAELTGRWERKLRKIERGEYDVKLFMNEMKQMVTDLVNEVKRGASKVITIEEDAKEKAKSDKKTENASKKTSAKAKTTGIDDIACPKCKNGKIMKGKAAFGCSLFNKSCDFKLDFTLFGKKLTVKQSEAILKKGKSNLIKGFLIDGNKTDGHVELNENFKPIFAKSEGKTKAKATISSVKTEILTCPKCGKGTMLKGKMAYGCSEYKAGCKTIVKFSDLKEKFGTDVLTADILAKI